jgi:hypothetical protein
MKRLLLAVLVSATAIYAAGRPVPAAADCVHHTVYYYETAARVSPACGYTRVYCNAPTVHVGCTTAYTTYVSGCICP